MRIKHVSLKSFTSATSVGVIVFDKDGCAEVTEEQGKFLCQPGLGFKSLEPAPAPVVAPVEEKAEVAPVSETVTVTETVDTSDPQYEESPEAEEPAPTPPATPTAKAAKPAPKKRR